MSTKTPERLSVTIVVIIIMISRPANNKYWGAEARVCILYQSPRPSLWPLYLWEESETSVSEICGSCNCTPRCAKWAVTRQEGSGLLTWLRVFLSPLTTSHSSLGHMFLVPTWWFWWLNQNLHIFTKLLRNDSDKKFIPFFAQQKKCHLMSHLNKSACLEFQLWIE